MISLISQNLFAFVLFIATVVSGIAWGYDYKFERPKRKARLEESNANCKLSSKERKALLEPKNIVGQVGSLFFILLVVFYSDHSFMSHLEFLQAQCYLLCRTVISSL